MRKYLATVAAVGLIAGVGAVQAQSPMEKKQMPGASSGSSAPTPAQQTPVPPATDSQPAQRGTVGQAPSSAAPPKADMKADSKADMKAGSKSGMSTDSKSGTSAQTDTKSGTSAGTKADTKSGASAQTDTKSGASTTGQAASGSINLTTQQKTEIREKVLVSAPKVTNVNFSLSVGTVVPRTVTLAAVPETLIVIHPQWRGYRYFVVRDEIVIVEPDTLRIVAVIVV